MAKLKTRPIKVSTSVFDTFSNYKEAKGVVINVAVDQCLAESPLYHSIQQEVKEWKKKNR